MSCSVTERVTTRSSVVTVGGPSGTGTAGATTAGRCRGGLTGASEGNTSLGTSPNARGGASAPPQNGPQSSPQGGPFRSKPCCSILWCCCCKCPCSNPSNKGNGENGPAKNSYSDVGDYCESIPTPTLEEIRSWGKSFDKLMRNPAGRKVFRDFLKGEYSEENILFWLACEDLKKQSVKEIIEERARLIYEDYISILSPKEVSLDSRVREIVNRNMVEPTPNTFDEAQLQIYTLMHRDSYPRFVNSQMYKTLSQNDRDRDQQRQVSSASSVVSVVDHIPGTGSGPSASTPLLAGPGPQVVPAVSSSRDQQNGS